MSDETGDILAICRAAFPGAHPLEVRSINPLPAKQHYITAFHLLDGQQRKALVVRRYPSPLGWAQFDDQFKPQREFTLLPWLRARGIPAPEPTGIGDDGAGSWLLQHAISGRQWWMPLGNVDFNKVLPGLVRQKVSLLARLHSLEIADAPVAAAHLPTLSLNEVLGCYYRALKKVGDRHVLAALERVIAAVAGIEERPPRLLHMNIDMEDVLVDGQGKITAWLDWDQAALGDPRWDVAGLVNSIAGGYHYPDLAERAVKQYTRETVRPVKDIKTWAALIAVLRWAQCSWLADQIKRRRQVDFPACRRFLDAYSSHRAWAMQLLNEAETQVSHV